MTAEPGTHKKTAHRYQKDTYRPGSFDTPNDPQSVYMKIVVLFKNPQKKSTADREELQYNC